MDRDEPALERPIRSGTTSRTTTSWPSSAKHAAVTRPTQPAPKTPIALGSLARRSLHLAEHSGRKPFATASIVSFDSLSSRVLTTQYAAPFDSKATMWSFEPLK